MVTVPVAMVTVWLPWKYRGFCIKVPSFDHVTRDPRDRPWFLALVDAEPLYFHTTNMGVQVTGFYCIPFKYSSF